MEMSRHSRHKNVLRPFYCDSGGKIFLSIVQFGANSCTLSVLSNTPTIYYYRLFRPKNKSKIKKNFGSGGAAAFPDSCMQCKRQQGHEAAELQHGNRRRQPAAVFLSPLWCGLATSVALPEHSPEK
jgi:hypothetical protein